MKDIGEIETLLRLSRARGASVESTPDARAGAKPATPLAAAAGIVLGSGDDAAIVRLAPDADLVATTDGFVEGRHYVPELFSAREIGARLAVANLSDLAAMAATPRWALLSLGVRQDHDVDALVALQEGALSMLEPEGAGVVGGNIAAVSGEEWASLTLLGEVARDRGWTRGGAKAGDLVVVTGHPGRAAAAYLVWQRLGPAANTLDWRALFDAWVRPQPRARLALALAAAGAVTAAIDVSDGLGGNLLQLCQASGVGAEVEEARWSPDPLILRAAETLAMGPTALRYGPSDDYELLLAVEPAKRGECETIARDLGVPLAVIGRFTASREVVRVLGGAKRELLAATGFDHFAR